MIGYLHPPDAPDPVAGANPPDLGRVDGRHHYIPVPLGAGVPNNDVLYEVYDGGVPNLALDRLRELRLRHQEDYGQQEALPQRPGRPLRDQHTVPQAGPAGIAIRLPRGNTF